jgi:hypothetical protein
VAAKASLAFSCSLSRPARESLVRVPAATAERIWAASPRTSEAIAPAAARRPVRRSHSSWASCRPMLRAQSSPRRPVSIRGGGSSLVTRGG